MKQFLKYTLATIVGILIASIITMFIFFGMLGSLLSPKEAVTTLKPNSVYQLDLSGSLVERTEDNPFEFLTGRYAETNIGLDEILANIRKAKDNPNIAGIQLNCGALSAGYASVTEIRDALADFKESGKFIVAYADSYTQKMYYLASVADQVLLNPIGSVEFQGISSTTMFYKNMLDKLGIEMQIVKVGEFKSAVEPYINTKMSDANRQQVTVYVNSIWQNLLNEVSEARGIAVNRLSAYADEALSFREAQKTLDYGFVDQLVYQSEVEEIVKTYMGETGKSKPVFVKHSAMKNVPEDKKYNKTKLAVIYAVGGIDMSETDGIVSKKLVKTINKVADDDAVKAVVFRINSGGGSAYGSEQIWYALTRLKAKKPLIVSMGDYAASGGYYIACMGDQIIAQPNTLTGSIGVFGQIPNIGKLSEKIGLNYDVVKTNKMSEGITIHRAFTPEERGIMQNYVNQTYELFVQRCADGRDMTTAQIKAIAEGRVWTGENALEIGLVDKLGNLNDAIALAAQAANIDSYAVAEYPAKEDFMSQLLKGMSDDVETRFLKSKLGDRYNAFREISNMENMNGIFALMPFGVEVR
ncbi:signal peptide peptidase SppA [Paludibacter sp. 221]|uniref:signal peptide peptidase SppA n=1 Tax=Paludibacter sp. 221 TaxID=2302939 RepID=UPI0013D7B577|nr:signal peptide peptidase SppA [Paludibacter sp. 221]NDV47739.1 signal peptide peptidase SppA [Paludibacter sp. 221]